MTSTAQIAQSRFGQATTVKLFDYTVGTTPTKIATNNPKRIQLAITNWGSGPVSFSTSPSVTATAGNPIAANGGNAVLIVTEDGEPVGWDYYAISATAGNFVHVEETEIV